MRTVVQSLESTLDSIANISCKYVQQIYIIVQIFRLCYVMFNVMQIVLSPSCRNDGN